MKPYHWLMLISAAVVGLAGGWLVQHGTSGSSTEEAVDEVLAEEQRSAEGNAGEAAAELAESAGEALDDGGMLGKERPGFALPDLDGETIDVARFDGDILVINFWATWCPPCVEEIPMLIDLQADFADEGVQVFGVAVEEPEPVIEFAEEFGIDYPLVADRRGGFEVAADYGNPQGLMPYTVFVDREGVIRGVHRGLLDREQAEQHLEAARNAD